MVLGKKSVATECFELKGHLSYFLVDFIVLAEWIVLFMIVLRALEKKYSALLVCIYHGDVTALRRPCVLQSHEVVE